MDSPGDIMRLCRLCLVKDQVNVPIFEDKGDIKKIFLKISSCLPVKVSRDDKLPKKICDGCSNKLDMLYEFWTTAANAEKTLLSWLGQAGVKDNDADETMSAVAQQIQKPAEPYVKQETLDPEAATNASEVGDHFLLQNFMQKFSYNESASTGPSATVTSNAETDEPPPKRARRTAAVKAQINISAESEEDDDNDAMEAMTKVEDESDESDGEDREPAYVDVPGTSGADDDQPGPSGVGKDGVEAPIPNGPNTKQKIHCDKCGVPCLGIDNLAKHRARIHPHLFFICRACGLQFSTIPILDRHQRAAHTPQEVATSESEYVARRLHDTPDFYCEVCGKGFNMLHELQSHAKDEHLKPQDMFKCEENSNKINTNAELPVCVEPEQEPSIVHLESHQMAQHAVVADAKPKMKVMTRVMEKKNEHWCRVCGKLIPNYKQYVKHVYGHEYPIFACIVCDKEFADHRAVCQHMESHEIFICYKCGQDLKNYKNLFSHRRYICYGLLEFERNLQKKKTNKKPEPCVGKAPKDDKKKYGAVPETSNGNGVVPSSGSLKGGSLNASKTTKSQKIVSKITKLTKVTPKKPQSASNKAKLRKKSSKSSKKTSQNAPSTPKNTKSRNGDSPSAPKQSKGTPEGASSIISKKHAYNDNQPADNHQEQEELRKTNSEKRPRDNTDENSGSIDENHSRYKRGKHQERSDDFSSYQNYQSQEETNTNHLHRSKNNRTQSRNGFEDTVLNHLHSNSYEERRRTEEEAKVEDTRQNAGHSEGASNNQQSNVEDGPNKDHNSIEVDGRRQKDVEFEDKPKDGVRKEEESQIEIGQNRKPVSFEIKDRRLQNDRRSENGPNRLHNWNIFENEEANEVEQTNGEDYQNKQLTWFKYQNKRKVNAEYASDEPSKQPKSIGIEDRRQINGGHSEDGSNQAYTSNRHKDGRRNGEEIEVGRRNGGEYQRKQLSRSKYEDRRQINVEETGDEPSKQPDSIGTEDRRLRNGGNSNNGLNLNKYDVGRINGKESQYQRNKQHEIEDGRQRNIEWEDESENEYVSIGYKDRRNNGIADKRRMVEETEHIGYEDCRLEGIEGNTEDLLRINGHNTGDGRFESNCSSFYGFGQNGNSEEVLKSDSRLRKNFTCGACENIYKSEDLLRSHSCYGPY